VLVLLIFIIAPVVLAQTPDAAVDSLLQGKTAVEQARLLNKLTAEVWETQPDKAGDYANRAFTAAKRAGGFFEMTEAQYNMGKYAHHNNNFTEAYTAFSAMIKRLESADSTLKKQLEWKKWMGKALKLQGMNLTFNSTKYDEAAKKLLDGLKILQEAGDNESIAYCLLGLGFVNRNLENYDKALEYFSQSIEVSVGLTNKKPIVSALNETGNIYMMKEDYKKSLEYKFQALEIAKNSNYKYGISFVTHDIGLTYMQMGELKEALRHLEISLQMDSSSNLQRERAINLENIGNIYRRLGDLKTAKKRLEESIEIAENINAHYELKSGYYSLAEILDEMNDTKKAYNYLKLYCAESDTFFDQQKIRQITEMEVQYQVAERKHQIELLEKEKAIQELKLKKQSLMIYLSTLGGILALAMTTGALFLYRFKSKAHKQMQAAHIEVMQSNKDLLKALEEVKQLKGLLPICANCKKIRDDQGYWQVLEQYISEHSEAEFSHGICPECAKSLYPEYYKEKRVQG